MPDILINVGLLVFLLSLGWFVGRTVERRHFQNLARREQTMADMLVTQIRSFPDRFAGGRTPSLVVSEIVIATDYLKSFLAKWRNLFGGEMKSYQTLLIRARREACLRLLEQARENGYDAVCNVRMETADVGGNTTKRRVAMVAILASGTAYDTAANSK